MLCEYAVTIPGQMNGDTELYGAIIRHGLRDVYVIPDVLERLTLEA